MRVTSFLPALILPLAFAAPTPTLPRHNARGIAFLHDHPARSNNWWENNGWVAGQSRVAPSQPVRPSQPVPSASGRSRREKEAKKPVPLNLPLGSPNDLARCPASSIACPTMPVLPELVTLDTEWECIEPEEDLYSCGGCTTLGSGLDCTAIPGVLSVSCQIGSCYVHTCETGYVLSDDRKSCEAAEEDQPIPLTTAVLPVETA